MIFTTVNSGSLAVLQNSLSASKGWKIADVVYLHNTQGWDLYEHTLDGPSINTIIFLVVIVRADHRGKLEVHSTSDNPGDNYQKVGTKTSKNMWKVCKLYIVVIVVYFFYFFSTILLRAKCHLLLGVQMHWCCCCLAILLLSQLSWTKDKSTLQMMFLFCLTLLSSMVACCVCVHAWVGSIVALLPTKRFNTLLSPTGSLICALFKQLVHIRYFVIFVVTKFSDLCLFVYM